MNKTPTIFSTTLKFLINRGQIILNDAQQNQVDGLIESPSGSIQLEVTKLPAQGKNFFMMHITFNWLLSANP